jgi:hypothetical protein
MVMGMWTAACDAGVPPVPQQQLAEDLEYATRTVEELTNAIAPDMPWQGGGDDDRGCFASDGRVIGYQAKSFLRLRSETVGHDIDDAGVFETARAWLTDRNYAFSRDTKHNNGTREIWAVKEDDTDGIGVAVVGHPGVVSVTATTKCRR